MKLYSFKKKQTTVPAVYLPSLMLTNLIYVLNKETRVTALLEMKSLYS